MFWSRGSGCLVYDDDNNSFLDLTSSFGVLSVGHCHPKVVDAIAEQSAKLIHGMGDVHPSSAKVLLLEKIASRSPIANPLITLGISGSDAVEAALKTAFLATGKAGVLAFEGAYHGLSYGALEPTHRPFFREPFADQRIGFTQHLPYGCLMEAVELAVADSSLPIGAVIVEPIQGRAGIRIPPRGWLKSLRNICDRLGLVLIFDEIFTGWGRTGAWFACEDEQIVPDLLCVGKGMGGGMPLSACLGSQGLMRHAWTQSNGEARHTSTFLGHPLSCAAALATIGVLEDDALVQRSATLGGALLESFQLLAEKHPLIIKEARGRGLMIALEFWNPHDVWSMVLSGLAQGLILLPAGDSGNVLEIVPPLILTDKQAAFAVDAIGRCVAQLQRPTSK